MPGGSLMENIMQTGGSDESNVFNILFDTKNFKRLKMISEISPSLMYDFVVLGVMQRRYQSTALKQFIEEFLTMQKSRDRQGLTEAIEVLLGLRKVERGEED